MFIGILFRVIVGFSSAFAVTGGEPVNSELSRSVVNVAFEWGACSGVVLSPTVLLLAAHCRDRFKKPLVAAYIRPDIITPKCDRAEVVEYSYEPSAEPVLPMKVHAPDLLMLRLKTPLCSVKPVTIAEEPLLVGDEFWQAGHGGGKSIHGQVEQVKLQLVEQALGAELSVPVSKYDSGILELLEVSAYRVALPVVEKTSACPGDSGGPSFVAVEDQMHLYGIIGAALPNPELGSKCHDNYVHLITPIHPYLDWIQTTLEKWEDQDSV